jgi:putative DNA primase/helicase
MVALEAVLRKLSDTRLIILDPVSAYLGGAGHNNAAIRRTLEPVKAVAERTGVAVVAITHLTKRRADSVLYRAIGSVAIAAAARAVWAVAPDRQAPGRMLFLPLKGNLVGSATGLAYRVVPSSADPAVPIVAWEPGAVALTADEAMQAAPKLSPREEAAEWLREILAGGPLPSTQIERQGREVGFSAMTLRRAKWDVGVTSHKEGSGWMCRLPDASQVASRVAEQEPAQPA